MMGGSLDPSRCRQCTWSLGRSVWPLLPPGSLGRLGGTAVHKQSWPELPPCNTSPTRALSLLALPSEMLSPPGSISDAAWGCAAESHPSVENASANHAVSQAGESSFHASIWSGMIYITLFPGLSCMCVRPEAMHKVNGMMTQ